MSRKRNPPTLGLASRITDAFILYLKAEKALAPSTLQAYHLNRRRLRRFLWLRRDMQPEIAGRHDLRAFVETRLKDVDPRSANHEISSIRQFYCFLMREGHRSDDPSRALARFKTWKVIP